MAKTKEETTHKRGTKIRIETGPEREKGMGLKSQFVGKEMKGGPRDVSHSITDGKVKEW